MSDNMLLNGLMFGGGLIFIIWLIMLGISNGHDAEIQREKEIAKADKEWKEWERERLEEYRKIRESNKARLRTSVSSSSNNRSSSSNAYSSHNDSSAAVIAATSTTTSSSSFTSCSPSSSSDSGCF